MALNLLGSIASRAEERERSRRLHEEALAIARDLGDRDIQAQGLNGLGQICHAEGEYVESLDYHHQALTLAIEAGARDIETQALLGIGNAHNALGSYPESLDYYHRAQALAEAIGHRQFQAYACGNIGMVHERTGDIASALSYELGSLALKEEMGDLWAAGVSLNNIGIIHRSLGNYACSLDYLLRSLDYAERIGDRGGEMVALHNIGGVYEALGDRTRVLIHHGRVLEIARELGDRQGEAFALGQVGRIHALLGDRQQAMLFLLRSLKLHQEIGDRYGERAALEIIGGCWRDQEEFERADEYFNRALLIAEEMGDRLAMISALLGMGTGDTRSGRIDRAVERLERALELAREGAVLEMIRNATRKLAEAYAAAGNDRRSRYYNRLYRDCTQRLFNREEAHRVRQLVAGFEQKQIRRQAEAFGLEAEDLATISEPVLLPRLDEFADDNDQEAEPAGSHQQAIEVKTFGELRVTIEGRKLRTADWGRKKARDLFKFLLIHHRRTVTIDEIIEKLWSGAADRNTELVVMNAVSRIRKALEPERSPRDPNSMLTSSDRTYRLDLGEDARIDFLEFKELVVMARRSSSASERRELYEAATALYTDDFMKEDLLEEWSTTERELLKDAFLEAMEYLAGEHLRSGALEQVVEAARRILGFDNTSERAYEVLLRALLDRGRRADALRLFEECRTVFRRELGIDPPERLRRIIETPVEAGE
jgi:DNA-binding SARP family transcriptional activator